MLASSTKRSRRIRFVDTFTGEQVVEYRSIGGLSTFPRRRRRLLLLLLLLLLLWLFVLVGSSRSRSGVFTIVSTRADFKIFL
jgi:hypothetical protein